MISLSYGNWATEEQKKRFWILLQSGIRFSITMFSKIRELVQESLNFYSQKGLQNCINDKNAPLLIQITKYGVCGLLVTFIHIIFVYTLGSTVNPAIGEHIEKDIKETRTIINNVIATNNWETNYILLADGTAFGTA